MNDKLHRIFDISEDGQTVVQDDSSQRISLQQGNNLERTTDEENVSLVKDNMKGMIKATATALEELINISMQSQSSKHFDSLANLIKALNESNRNLFEMSTLKIDSPETQTNIQNNTAVFVGSTTDFLKAIKDAAH